jgi:hypothetical protein
MRSDFFDVSGMLSVTNKNSRSYRSLAAAGLIAKGIVYCLLGMLAFMSAFHISGRSISETDEQGVFSFIENLTGGKILLALIAAGLVCYTIWRSIQAFRDTENKGSDSKGILKRARYLLSGLLYLSVAALAIKMILFNKSSGDKKQDLASALLDQSYGPLLVGLVAVLFITIGLYQVYYGLKEKFRKNISLSDKRMGGSVLNNAAKLGYAARGVTWILIGWLFGNAALHANASEAGDSSKALSFASQGDYGKYLLAAIGIGLICYGIFNFIRARFEQKGEVNT